MIKSLWPLKNNGFLEKKQNVWAIREKKKLINWNSKLKLLLFQRYHLENEKASHRLVRKVPKGWYLEYILKCLQSNNKKTTQIKILPKDLNIIQDNKN